MLNLESKDYKSYVGRTFDSWDDFIDANGEVILDRDTRRHKLEQDFAVREFPDGRIQILGTKDVKPTPAGTNEQKQDYINKITNLEEKLHKNERYAREFQKIMALGTEVPAQRPLAERDLNDIIQYYRMIYREYLKYCQSVNVEEFIASGGDLKNIEGKKFLYHKYEPQPRKKPESKRF
jgi:hypothetical protein